MDIELAKKIASFGLCDSCLGRQFINIEGSNNKERGRNIRKLLSIEESRHCWLCDGIMNDIEKLADIAINALKEYEFDRTNVFSYSDEEGTGAFKLEDKIEQEVIDKRAQILGSEQRGTTRVITALVPLAEISGYATILRSLTQGRASFYMEPSHYEEVPQNITEKIINKNKEGLDKE